ncbi:MAG: arsenate reductase (glutaredoxin) [Oligoflexus sp.]
MKIYHNPRCSKSRQTLALLQENHVTCEVIEYLKNPPSRDELADIVAKLGLRPKDLVRVKDAELQEIQLDLENDEAVLQALARYPSLLQRPIVVTEEQAVIGRPPENVLNIL